MMTKKIIISLSRSLLISIIFIGASYNIILGNKEVEYQKLDIIIFPGEETVELTDSPLIKFRDGSKNNKKLIYKIGTIIDSIHNNTLTKCKIQKMKGRVPYEVKKDINSNSITLSLSSTNILDLKICKDEIIDEIELVFEDQRAQILGRFFQHKKYKFDYEVSQRSFAIFSGLQNLVTSGKQTDKQILEIFEQLKQQAIDYQNNLYDLSEQKIKDFKFLKSIDYKFLTVKEDKVTRKQSLVILVFFSLFILLTLLDIKFIQKLSLRKIINKFFK